MRHLNAAGKLDEALRIVFAPLAELNNLPVVDELPRAQWLEAELLRARVAPGSTALDRALDTDARDGFVWTYLREGDGLNELLRHATSTTEPWRDTVLSRALHVPVSARSTTVQVLSDAELRVLQLLPSHRSTAEISDEMFVSVNTVKTHVRGLYRKLQVTTRAGAVHRATDLGLIVPA